MKQNQEMKIDVQTGRLLDVRFVASPNFDDREGDEISLCVIHNISLPPSQFGGSGVIELFTNCLDPDEHEYYQCIHALRVSSHVFIRRDGEIIQFVPFHKRAWHAGVSSFEGREKCNEYSVGIELEGSDEQAFESVQYDQLNQIILALKTAYPQITDARITGHSDIAPGRKTDPGPFFEWHRIK